MQGGDGGMRELEGDIMSFRPVNAEERWRWRGEGYNRRLGLASRESSELRFSYVQQPATVSIRQQHSKRSDNSKQVPRGLKSAQ